MNVLVPTRIMPMIDNGVAYPGYARPYAHTRSHFLDIAIVHCNSNVSPSRRLVTDVLIFSRLMRFKIVETDIIWK